MPSQSRRPQQQFLYDQKPTNAQGPHLYGGVNKGPVPGIEGGGALFSGGGRDEKTGLTGAADLVYAEGYAGGRSDGKVGVGGRAGMFNVEGGYEGNGVMAKVKHNALTAEADAHVGPDDAGFAVGADLIGVGAEFGTKDAESKADETFGISASISSPGASAHLKYGDSDGDGYREYGFDVGGKLGPGVGLSYTTEDPVRSAMKLGPGALVDPFIPKDVNLTEGAINGAKAVGGAIKDGWDWLWN